MLLFFKQSFRFSSESFKMLSSYKCKVAVCQITGTHVKESNFKIVEQLVSKAVEKEAKFIFLPESCDYIARGGEEAKELSEPINGNLMSEYKKLAKLNNVWLSIGGFHERTTNQHKMCNSHVIINDQGKIEAIYRKMHLLDVNIPDKVKIAESDSVEKGNVLIPPVNSPVGPLGLAICYDLRFPELSTLLRKMGATVLTYPSAFFNETGKAHWEAMLKSRAIENQCYVIAAAHYGRHNDKRISYGHSMIVDPWGKIIAECPKYNPNIPTDSSIAIATIDSTAVYKIRQEMPVFDHRRDDIYKLIALDKQHPGEVTQYLFADKVIPTTTVFYASQYSYAFTNIRCVVPGHVLIASIRKTKRLQDLSAEEVADFFQTAVKVQEVVEKVYLSNSSTVCVQDGVDAGQTMAHVHCHILPRKPGDFNKNDDVYLELAKHDQNDNPQPIRTLEEMVKEADLLRNYFYT